MDKSKTLFFIALLPPQDIFAYVNDIKQHFAQNYASRAALKSPPHITLQPPFEWSAENLPVLEESLGNFTRNQNTVPIILSGFGAFPPRVIYVNVIKTPALLNIQAQLSSYLENNLGIVDAKSKNRPFSPHMTVAFKDLSKQNFQAAWPEYKDRELQFTFSATHLTLLRHDGSRWNIHSEFPFSS